VSKVAVEQLAILTQIGWLDEILPRSHFVLIERADQLAQAISLAIAEQNDRWSVDQMARVSDERLRYDRAAIARALGYVIDQAALMRWFFGVNGLVPISVNFERLARDPQRGVDEIAQAAGLDKLVVNMGLVRTKRQSGPVNAEWRARYLSGERI
jgi:LPS sulfotransferase NodH